MVAAEEYSVMGESSPSLKRHEPLYLKHRPQSLAELVGQKAVVQTLTNAINHQRISHAYLFTGPRGTGKTSSARILAKSLNCKAGEAATVEPCLQCASCEEIKNGTSPAVFEIDAASNNSVDDARTLIERAPLVAPGARYKIYIIDECHMLSTGAFNALLKTIEQPPPNVVFVLATTEEHKVIPTIVSRCQRLMFRLVQHGDLLQHLRSVADTESIEITDKALEFVARRSGGGLRDALGLLDQASLLSAPGQPVDLGDLLNLLGALNEDALLEMSGHISERRGHELLSCAGKLLRDGREPAVLVQELARHFLNLAKASYLSDTPNAEQAVTDLIVGSPDYLNGLLEQAKLFERSELSQMVEVLDRLEGTCKRTTQPGMHLEVGLLSLCHRQDMVLLREIGERVKRLEQGAPAPIANFSQPSARPAAAAPAPTAVSNNAPAQAAPRPQPAAAPAPQAAPAAAAPARPAPAPASVPQADSAPSSLPAVGAAAPAKAPAAQASSDDDSAGTVSADEVDRVWGAILEELQRRNIPAFSIVNQHAFALSMNEKEIVIGTREPLLKMVESKLDHLKAACAARVGSLHIRLKAVSNVPTATPAPAARQAAPAAAPSPAPQQGQPAPRQQERPSYTQSSGAPGPDEDDDPYDEPGLQPREKLDDVSRSAAPRQAPAETDGPAPAAPEVRQPDTDINESPQQKRRNDATIVKEAYKLFEGPGSRQIG